MTREEVYKGLEQADAYFRSSFDAMYGTFACEKFRNWVDAIEHSLALLKEQEPVEPIVDVDEWRCGNCGHKLEHQELLGENVLFHEQYSYCPQCGRAVKWNG